MMTYVLRGPRNNHIIILSILAFLSLCAGPTKKEVTPPNQTLIAALIEWESGKVGGYDEARGDKKNGVYHAWGCLQIHLEMVDEVNRISKILKLGKSYKSEDRWDRAKSIEMFVIYTNYWTPDWEPQTVARRWNGGPTGDSKRATLPYWANVKPILTRLEKEKKESEGQKLGK